MHRARRALQAAALLSAAAPVSAAAPASSTAPVISAIRVERVNVFDPNVKGEDWWPFRAANVIHVLTKEQVVRRELLLGIGDPWVSLHALESERNLRSLGLFRKAELRPESRPDGSIALVARTQDAWTLNIQLSVGTEGGESFFTFGVAEDNLLGSGKGAGFLAAQSGSKRTKTVFYRDPRFFATRLRLSPFYSRTDRGDSIGTDLVRPFFSLETPYAMGLSWRRTVEETALFTDAEESTRFLQRTRVVGGSYGLRLKGEESFVQRLEGGWYSERQEFQSIPETAAGTLPVSREFSGPSAGYSWVRPKYIKETYIDRMERVEDFNMGNELRLFGLFAGTPAGSDRDRWLFNLVDQQGLYLSPGRFALASVGASGRVARGQWDNAIFFANANLFWKTHWPFPQTWVGHVEGATGRGVDKENQFVLGGNTGLRGYKNNSFVGAKSVLVNLENRVFFPGEYFHLLRFGAAAFFESGAVVPEGSGISPARFRSDVGVGLRLSSTRSQSGGVARIDVAYALNEGPGGSRWVVSIRGGQAFQIFGSATTRVRQSPASNL